MRALALLLATVLSLPLSIAHDDGLRGVIHAGTGAAHAPGVDHVAFHVPPDARGVVSLLDGSAARFGLASNSCPPDMACTQVILPPCLVIYAEPGAVAVPFAFRWTDDPSEGLAFESLPVVARLLGVPCEAPDGPHPA